MLTLFDIDLAVVYERLLDSAIQRKLSDTGVDPKTIKTGDINEILGDFAHQLNYTSLSKPAKKINWKKEPHIKPLMNRAFVLRRLSSSDRLPLLEISKS
ncbi:hypothetical protein V9T40_003076 [Parthenolecanium corni]|uniref:Uncharacterized protein n=1 Tax=Parthenolecanium corni TaxID=536013 RepID=A0AAN9Y9U1_9HEMI